MKKFLSEFKTFIQKGSVMDMAVGVIIGAAFKSIVDSLVGDIISPFLGIFLKNDFSGLAVSVNNVPIRYGAFITNVINFLIIALVLFLLIKGLNSLKYLRKTGDAAPAAPTAKTCPYCRSEVPILATRCPHCTSQFVEDPS